MRPRAEVISSGSSPLAGAAIRQISLSRVIITSVARQTTVTVTDDLDGSANAKEVSFSLDGTSWTIDLNTKNRAALAKALAPYIAKATQQPQQTRRGRTGTTAKGPRRTSSRRARGDLGEIRTWANSNGYAVSNRGRISSEVQQAYDSAH